jgi:hypothetical protein
MPTIINHPLELQVGDTRITSAKDNDRYRITSIEAGRTADEVRIRYAGDSRNTYLIDTSLCPFFVEKAS